MVVTEVAKVEVHGTRRMDAKSVYDIALGQVDRSMLNVELAGCAGADRALTLGGGCAGVAPPARYAGGGYCRAERLPPCGNIRVILP